MKPEKSFVLLQHVTENMRQLPRLLARFLNFGPAMHHTDELPNTLGRTIMQLLTALVMLLTISSDVKVSARIHCYSCGASTKKLITESFYVDKGEPKFSDYPGAIGENNSMNIDPDVFIDIDLNDEDRMIDGSKQECDVSMHHEMCLRDAKSCFSLHFPKNTNLKPQLGCGSPKFDCDRVVRKFIGPPTCKECYKNLCNAGGKLGTSNAAPLISLVMAFLFNALKS